MYRERRARQQGVNWGLIFGGAVATVLSVAFSRSNKRKKNVDSDGLSLRRESSSGSSSSKSDTSSEGDEILSVFNRTAVHKLRHQLKSRDEMIMEMQSQLTDKERAIFSHKSLINNLEKQLTVANRSISEVERVIHELRENGTPASSTPRSQEQDGQQMVVRDQFVEYKDVDGDKRSLVVHAKEGEYGLVFQRAKHLEAELVGIRAMAQEMASLLDMSERERLRLHHVVSQLQQKLAFQAKELSTMRATTHFLKLSLDSSNLYNRSGNETETLGSRLSHEEDELMQLNRNGMHEEVTFNKAQQRYAAVSESVDKMEVSEMDSSVKEDNSTSSSASSYPEFSDGTEWSAAGTGEVVERIVAVAEYNNNGFRSEDSPGPVQIGSPTIAGSRSVDGLGLAARRYLFEETALTTSTTTEQHEEEDEAAAFSSLGVLVEEQKSSASSSSSSSVTDEMLDDTLEDLIRATTPTAVSFEKQKVVED